MTQAIERMLAKVKARHQARQHNAHPADAIFILCDRPEDVPQRVEVLIAVGKLTAADRLRCVFCDADTFVAMTHDQRVHVWAINETEEDRRRIAAESAAQASAALAEIVAAAEQRKK